MIQVLLLGAYPLTNFEVGRTIELGASFHPKKIPSCFGEDDRFSVRNQTLAVDIVDVDVGRGLSASNDSTGRPQGNFRFRETQYCNFYYSTRTQTSSSTTRVIIASHGPVRHCREGRVFLFKILFHFIPLAQHTGLAGRTVIPRQTEEEIACACLRGPRVKLKEHHVAPPPLAPPGSYPPSPRHGPHDLTTRC